MCDLCRRTPCHPRCPNAPDPPVVHICCDCGSDIYDGDTAYNINGEIWCAECIENRCFVAEAEFDI